MNDNENRRYQMFVRVRDFGSAHKGDFAATGLARQLFNTLSTTVDELDNHSTTQASGLGSARQGTSSRALARSALREDLEAINRTARAMADELPGIADKFRLPRDNNDQHLLNAARAFHRDATPLSAQFIAHELPADFLENLNSAIEALEAAISSQGSSVGGYVAAGAAIEDAISRALDLVRKLDAIVRNKYANDPAILAEWTSASHTQRAPKHQKSPLPPPPPGSGTGTPSPSA